MIDLVLKVTVLIGLSVLVAALLRRAPAAARHFVWVLSLSGALALTVATPFVPAVRVPIASWPAPEAPGIVPSIVPSGAVTADPAPPAGAAIPAISEERFEPPPAAGQAMPFRSGELLVGIWLLGALIVSGWWVVGHLGLARLARRAAPLGGEWQRLLARLALESGVRAPVRLLRSPAVGSPVVWGARRPVILLPDDAENWSGARRRAVLAHELAHAARGDYAAQLVGCITCTVYWFHPLAWVGLSRLRAESERAADDQVLLHGMKAVEYARHLLEVARRSGELRTGGLVAIGMARRSHLEGRLLAVLDDTRARQAVRVGRRLLGWAGLVLLVLPLAALRPVSLPSASPQQGPEESSPKRPRTTTTTTTTSSTTRTRSSDQEREGREVKLQIEGRGAATGDSTLDRILQASPGGELDIDLETGGDVTVTGWDRPQVEVRARLGGRDWRGTEVLVEGTARGARLRARQGEAGRTVRTSHLFEIRVPKSFNIRINSAGGALALRDLRGNFTGHTGGGGFTIERLNGEMTLSTGGGDIEVSDSDLRGRVSTGGGSVRLSNARGGGLVGSSGSGPVIYSDGGAGNIDRVTVNGDKVSVGDERTGALHISKAGGAISLDGAPNGATVHTGGGNITIGRSRGLVSATTGGGDIEIGPIAGSVRAGTGAGNIRITIIDGAGGERSVDVTSGTGSLILELPSDISARFEIETAYTENFGRRTRIDSDFELAQEETERWDRGHGTPRKYVRATGEVGNGRVQGLIRVQIVNGDVLILRRPK